jgi:thymidylate kinase
MSQKPMFICITGIDGVGKTTHVNLIIEHLREKGIKCQYKWLRFHHLFSLPLLAFCRVAGYTRLSTLGNFQKCSYHEFYKSRFVSAIYPWILFFDTFLFTTIKVYIPMFFGTSIVCDRFVYDTLIDIAVATKDHEIYKKSVGKLFLKLIPKNARFVMLDLDKSTIFSRRSELKNDLTFGERYELYTEFSRLFDITIVYNGNINSIDSTIKGVTVTILKKLELYYA